MHDDAPWSDIQSLADVLSRFIVDGDRLEYALCFPTLSCPFVNLLSLAGCPSKVVVLSNPVACNLLDTDTAI